MVRFTTSLIPRLGAALAALLVVGTLQAEPPRKKVKTTQSAVHQMEIFNGPSRTVRNFGIGLSTSEIASLSDLERYENEATFANDVLALKRQYVLSEGLLEPSRRLVQQELYGRAVTRTNYDTLATNAGYQVPSYGIGGFGVGGLAYNRPAVYSTALSGERTTEVRSLADGVGDEGALKTSLAATIAKQAVPSYAAAVAQDFRQASSTAALSPRLRAGLGLQTPDEIRKTDNAIRAANYEAPLANRVTLTLADGKKIVGTNLQEGKDWITLERLDGGSSRFRLSQVVQIDLPSASGGRAKPAVDE